MSFLLKNTIHRVLAESFYDQIVTQQSDFYYYIGKVVPWSVETSPEAPLDTQQYEYDTRNNIISVKKITSGDVSFVVRRINWASGTVYDQFDSYSASFPSDTGATSLKNSRFYVLTNEFNVYKCLFNNNGGASTVKPNGTDVVPISTADDYVWKYLYTIPLSNRNRFLTQTFMPVQRSVTSRFYSDGQVDSIIIDNPGSGYSGNSNVSLRVFGTFTGNTGNSIANLVPVFNASGQFVNVIIKDAGNKYSSANIAIIDSGGVGSGFYPGRSSANMYPILNASGRIDRVLIDDPGIGYSTNTQTVISLIGDGANAILTPFVNEVGEIEKVIIENRGEGYTFLDIEVEGDGANASIRADLSVGDLDSTQSSVELSATGGSIEAFRINNTGTGYTAANVTVTGDGTGFIGTVVLGTGNSISYVAIVDSGSGYTYANVIITGNGSNANASAIISPLRGHGFDPVAELFADTIIVYSTINNEFNQGISVNNDYRQFGIISDIKNFNNFRQFTSLLGSTCYLITVTNAAGLVRDAQLSLSSNFEKKFEVVEVLGNQVLILDKNNYELDTTDSLYNSVTTLSYDITSIDAEPDINKFSGDLLFIDNRTSISYSDQQLVTLRTTIQF